MLGKGPTASQLCCILGLFSSLTMLPTMPKTSSVMAELTTNPMVPAISMNLSGYARASRRFQLKGFFFSSFFFSSPLPRPPLMS
jgi:hypothetical protein